MDDRPVYLNTTRLKESLGYTWHLFLKYWDLDVIPQPDALAGDKPLWLSGSVNAIRERINDYEKRKAAAKYNTPIYEKIET